MEITSAQEYVPPKNPRHVRSNTIKPRAAEFLFADIFTSIKTENIFGGIIEENSLESAWQKNSKRHIIQTPDGART